MPDCYFCKRNIKTIDACRIFEYKDERRFCCLNCNRELAVREWIKKIEDKIKFFCYACDRYIPSSVGCERVLSASTEQRSYLCLKCTARLNGTVTALITKCSACGRSERINPGDRLCSPCMEAAIVTMQNYYERIGMIKPEPKLEPEKTIRLILI